jgi:hypothetical protein
MALFHYYIPANGEGPEDASAFESANSVNDWGDGITNCWIAEDAAGDYHDRRAGWEAHWPVEFTILDKDMNELGSVKVDRESRPVFSAI